MGRTEQLSRDPSDQPWDIPGPTLEELARQARTQAVMDVMREFAEEGRQ